MRQSWSEIRSRARAFAERWKDARYERGETQTFYNEFFEIFGVSRRRVASFEEPVKKLGGAQGFIDLFWKGTLLVEQKSAGRDLKPAKQQAFDYFPGLREADLPRYVMLSDFKSFELYDLDEGHETTFTLKQLPSQIAAFAFVLGVQTRTFKDQDPVNIKASELMGRLHDALKSTGYDGHDLERLLVRLLFCLFADDMGIFQPRGLFQDFLIERTRADGADLGPWLNQLFDVLNRVETRRQTNLDVDLKQFPYINGELFAERLPTSQFDSAMRTLLLEACAFDWSAISPAIFGSLFQSVMKKEERRKSGAHYTTERNILKVIQPLFLDGLREEFENLRKRRGTGRTRALTAFHDKLAALTFFDPACGCGNFLIIAYRELRQLELELLGELHVGDRQFELDVASLSRINVDQFYGIEIGEFPARIAEVALWMTDHAANNRLSLEFGNSFARIPLVTSPRIVNADALDIDWETVIPASQCTYVFGNPPFIGQSYQSPEQRAQMQRIVGGESGRGGSLDYVTAWFLKAGAYVARSLVADQSGNSAQAAPQIAFVSTNSVTQGEQVAQLWPVLFGRYELEIAFAHQTFAWGSDARGKAHVHVVIIGLVRRENERPTKRLFSYLDINGNPVETTHTALTPYLFDGGALPDRHMVVRERRTPFDTMPPLRMGSKIVDDGIYIFETEEKDAFIAKEPGARPLFCPLIGSEEFINGKERWILRLDNVSPSVLRRLPFVSARIAEVRKYRAASKKAKTRELADFPTQFEVTTIPDRPFLAVPKVSSERREYLPLGWLEPPVLPSQLVQVLVDAEVWHFAIMTSAMHMAWLRRIGGRLKSDYQYSIGLVYNAFPWPALAPNSKEKLNALGQAVLYARSKYPDSTLADLYDRELMKPDLRKAHQAIDIAVDRLYRTAPFSGDADRIQHLFGLYERLMAPLTTVAKPRARRRIQ